MGIKFKESGAKIRYNSSKITVRSTVPKAVTLSDSGDVKRRKIQTSAITSPDISKITLRCKGPKSADTP